MKARPFILATILLTVLAVNVPAAVRYVDLNSTNPVSPYADWSTAATNIQDAIDVATNGDEVLVTNGVYHTGSRSLDGSTTNRVAVSQPLTVRSVNGPTQTVIDGGAAVRCVYLVDGAVLDGFTLQNGMVAANGGGVAGDTTNALVINCIITQNTADYGGGIFQCTASRCTISTNSAYYNGYYGTGGGANGSILNDCLLDSNFGYEFGGAAVNTTMNNCTVTGNHSRIYPSTFDNCTANNCIIYFNYGVFYIYDGQLVPVYFTYNGGSGTYDHCCITPDPGGTGNITDDPLFVDAANGDFHLQTNSPCINAGNNDAAPTDTDLDGVIRIQGGTVDIGAYESPGYVIPIMNFTADRTNVIPGYPISFFWRLFFTNSPMVLLDYGDGTVVTNAVSGTAHSWSAPGNYTVQLIALSSDYPSGTNASITIHIADATNYVSLACTNPVPPYNSWATAATNIQDAVDVAVLGATVMVSNGVYDVGGRGLTSLTNRVLIPIQLAVKSVNGPAVTTIVGNQVPGTINDFGAVRCVYLADGATLSGFTLTNGATEPGNNDGVYESSGGGVECGSSYSTVTNCVLINNSAGDYGGGAAGGTFYNCQFIGNQSGYGGGVNWVTANNCLFELNSGYVGGGVEYSTLNNCTLTGNSASYGGGADFSTLNDCILAGNLASDNGGGANGCTLSNCTLTGNSAVYGGGTESCTVTNCTLVANGASYGGGADESDLNNCLVVSNSVNATGAGVFDSTLINCVVWGNSASDGTGGMEGCVAHNCIIFGNDPGNHFLSSLDYCCTLPLPDSGAGNFTSDPVLTDPAGGDFHLQSNSPCINSGKNDYVTGATDLDGNPRIKGGTVDIGAYEYQTPTSVISYAWLQQYGLTNNGSADFADADGDGMNNWQEWRTGTIPTDPSSLLKMTTVANDVSGMTVTWQSVSGVTYFLQRSTDLTAQPAFSTIQTDIAGQPGTTSYTDTDATGPDPYFYRVGVQ